MRPTAFQALSVRPRRRYEKAAMAESQADPAAHERASRAPATEGFGRSMRAYLLASASLSASRFLPAAVRCTTLPSRSWWSAHQSAAMLCHLRRVSGSALDMYSLRTFSLTATLPEVSIGSSGVSPPPGASVRCISFPRTITHPSTSLSSLGRASKSAVLQWLRFLGSSSSADLPSMRASQRRTPSVVRQYTFLGALPFSPTTGHLCTSMIPSRIILPSISDAYDLETPSPSPIPSCVMSSGAEAPVLGSKCLCLYRCSMAL